MSNKINYPEAWAIFQGNAMNIMEEEELKHLGNYRIPDPRYLAHGAPYTYLYSECPGDLFTQFKKAYYCSGVDSPSPLAAVHYIANTL